MMQKDKRYIAFVCTGNTCRSPMAEGIFNKLSDNIKAESFGVDTITSMPISEKSVEVCKEIDVDISTLRSTYIGDTDIEKYEKFYCMSQSHAEVLTYHYGVSSEKIEVLNIFDPYGGNLEIYRQCRDEIYNSVREILKSYED